MFNYYQLNFRVNLNKRLASDLLRNYLYMPYNLYFKKNSSEMIRDAAANAVSELSGVNMDDEAAQLIEYQQAYQASARVLQTARELFDTLLQSV